MPRSTIRGVSGRAQRHSTLQVDPRSTEPRVGSSNLSGRAARSENSHQSEFIAALLAAGIPRADAQRVIDAFRVNARRAAIGRISTPAAIRANQALLERVLLARLSAKAVAA